MPFFPRFHYPEAASTYPASSAFPTDILRIFEGLDNATSGPSQSGSSATGRRAFSPNFDVHETQHEYILEGELPGLSDKKNVSIEFTDDKTILIQGKIERQMRGWTDDAGNFKTIEGAEQKKLEQSGGENKGGQEKEKGAGHNDKEKEKRSKYWVSERSVGEFSRSFSFPGHVDVDNVKANLDHGILKVVVPKLEKKSGRKIEVA
jgi:HSP20 family molecular chaperone IbpA